MAERVFVNNSLKKVSPRQLPVKVVHEDFICKICNRPVVDPRVLECFHSFCLTCIRDWKESMLTKREVTGVEFSDDVSNSGFSGYDSVLSSDDAGVRTFTLSCPDCGTRCKIPPGGLAALPPDYILKQRMILASANETSICVLCDLCCTDIPAVVRCFNCTLNLCRFCSDSHQRQRGTSDHELADIHRLGNVSLKRPAMCLLHLDTELSLYCLPCEQVVCRDCCILLHRGHSCEVIARVAKLQLTKLRENLKVSSKAKSEAELTLEKLNVKAQRVEIRCSQVEGEIDKFVESYLKAVDEHGKQLKSQVMEARAAKLQVVNHHRRELEEIVQCAGVALRFGQDLLDEGSETEVLTFAGSLMKKLECLKPTNASYLTELKLLETLNFLPDEKAGNIFDRQMFGMVTTQRVSPAHCILAQDGLTVLNNCRQQQRCEVILLTRDSDGQPICHGGEHIRVEARYRDISRRSVPVSLLDRQDGSYSISFIPDSPGNMLLSVMVQGEVVKGSPFPVCVQTLRPHHGTFHCCTFCSSGGRRDASCGCGGQMPGGYEGCGHGHAGHPGRRHWSCCGNTLLNSECARPPQVIQLSS